jgi:hypothetical protein
VRLATVQWGEGNLERQLLVGQLPSDPARVVDLNRLEQLRLAKLGEGQAAELAQALVPSCLARILEGGPRALHRVRQVLRYAEKWEGRGGLPEALAPRLDQVRLLPCLPRPAVLRRWDGTHLDRLAVRGPEATLGQAPVPTLALLGMHGGLPAGCCLAVDDVRGVVLGGWLELDLDWDGVLELRIGGQHRRLAMDTWRGLALPALRAGEVLLAPPPELRWSPIPEGTREVRLGAAFETLTLGLGENLIHPTIQ